MRRALIPWVLFGLALVAIAVPMAQGTTSAKDPRVAGLIKKVNALTKRVAVLETRSACISVVGIAQFGAPAQADGYMYKRAADQPGSFINTTALDGVAQGQTAQLLMAVVDPKCVTGSRTLYRTARAPTHRTAVYSANG
jgi:hypothetical protein